MTANKNQDSILMEVNAQVVKIKIVKFVLPLLAINAIKDFILTEIIAYLAQIRIAQSVMQ